MKTIKNVSTDNDKDTKNLLSWVYRRQKTKKEDLGIFFLTLRLEGLQKEILNIQNEFFPIFRNHFSFFLF